MFSKQKSANGKTKKPLSDLYKKIHLKKTLMLALS